MTASVELPVAGTIVSTVARRYDFTGGDGKRIEGVKRTVSILPDADQAHPFEFAIRDEVVFSEIEAAGFGKRMVGVLQFRPRGNGSGAALALDVTCVSAKVIGPAAPVAPAPANGTKVPAPAPSPAR